MTSLPEWVVANVAANPNTLLYLWITHAFIGSVCDVVKLIQLLHPCVEVIQFYRNLFFRPQKGKLPCNALLSALAESGPPRMPALWPTRV